MNSCVDVFFFCTLTARRFVTKHAMVNTFCMAAKLAGDFTVLTGHTLRVTGARLLASMNISVLMIQLLGIWDSSVILRYITDAPFVVLDQGIQGGERRLNDVKDQDRGC